VNNRAYALSNTNVNGLPNSSIQSSIPMFNIDSGVYFDRAFSMAGQQYTQTLEPRIYYLYVPYRNQSDIPIFDTGINTFTYSSLFQNNRFSGIDRIGDANQISTAVSTNVNNAQGQTLLTAAIGQIYYFRDRDVTICTNTPGSPPCVQIEDPYYNKPQSDLAGLFTYNFNPQWSFNSNATYNPYTASTDMQSYQFQFKPDAAHLFNFGYQDTQNDYSLLTTQQLLQGMQAPRIAQLTASFIWQLLPQWNLMGLSNYSLNEHRLVSIFGGIQYSSCCWSVSLVQSRYLTSTDPNNPQIIDGPAINATVLQFELKGLGGTSDQIGLYAQQIPGYDPNLSGF
jgi:LPS-assembly protein